MSSQFPSGYGDFYSFTPVTALAKPQQFFGTHLDQVGLPWSQPPQLGAGRLKWPNLLEKKKIQKNLLKCFGHILFFPKMQHENIFGEYFM